MCTCHMHTHTSFDELKASSAARSLPVNDIVCRFPDKCNKDTTITGALCRHIYFKSHLPLFLRVHSHLHENCCGYCMTPSYNIRTYIFQRKSPNLCGFGSRLLEISTWKLWCWLVDFNCSGLEVSDIPKFLPLPMYICHQL